LTEEQLGPSHFLARILFFKDLRRFESEKAIRKLLHGGE
jgi:hypothetical protein